MGLALPTNELMRWIRCALYKIGGEKLHGKVWDALQANKEGIKVQKTILVIIISFKIN